MFFAHGSGGDAGRCGNNTDRTGMSWPHLADEYNFIYICGEAVQQDAVNNITGQLLTGGIWAMPEVGVNRPEICACFSHGDRCASMNAGFQRHIWATLHGRRT